MKSLFLFVFGIIFSNGLWPQNLTRDLTVEFQKFVEDSQLRHAVSSIYVINARTGEVIFDKNSRVGLAPASTQKIITSVTAFELLGKDYRYVTKLEYDGEIKKGELNGNLLITGSGDPTFGSWRYASTKEEKLLEEFANAILKNGVRKVSGKIISRKTAIQTQQIPDGWIWQDIGNYYGAGVSGLNWRENQYDLVLRSGDNIGDPVTVVKTVPTLQNDRFISEVKTAAKSTGDNAYIYLPERSNAKYVRGTIPAGETAFVISGSMNDPDEEFLFALRSKINGKIVIGNSNKPGIISAGSPFKKGKLLFTHYSPSLDSIIYWFNRKSINLYGEALVRTFALEKQGYGRYDSGVNIVKKFWAERGINENELNIYDGSGLSPLNRVTTHAQVEILKYARTKEWFPLFYEALPEFNKMKMKSGTISDAKGFCGYHVSRDGNEYIFSFLVNNYNGKASQLVSKMYKVLDLLK